MCVCVYTYLFPVAMTKPVTSPSVKSVPKCASCCVFVCVCECKEQANTHTHTYTPRLIIYQSNTLLPLSHPKTHTHTHTHIFRLVMIKIGTYSREGDSVWFASEGGFVDLCVCVCVCVFV
jgi:hypothetical protein